MVDGGVRGGAEKGRNGDEHRSLAAHIDSNTLPVFNARTVALNCISNVQVNCCSQETMLFVRSISTGDFNDLATPDVRGIWSRSVKARWRQNQPAEWS